MIRAGLRKGRGQGWVAAFVSVASDLTENKTYFTLDILFVCVVYCVH